MTTIHQQVEASCATVDEGIAELLECVWAAGIKTQFSCQGGDPDDDGKPQPAMIVFATVDGALQFMGKTMARSFWYNRLTMRLAEPLHGPVRASVSWPVTDRHTGRAVTPALTDVWADRQRVGDTFTRCQPAPRVAADDVQQLLQWRRADRSLR